MPTGWVFRLEILSKKTPDTREIIEEISQRFLESELIDGYLIEELHEDIKLFNSLKKEEAH